MRTKCFAALILSVALFGCGSKGSSSPAVASYPVTSSFGLFQEQDYCQSLFTSVTLDFSDPAIVSSCMDTYLAEVRVRLSSYYNRSFSIWNICIGNPGLCQDPTRMENFARDYHI